GGSQALEQLHRGVEIRSDLELENAEPAPDVLPRLRKGLPLGLDADRDRRGERVVDAAEEVDQRDAPPPCREIVQSDVDRGLCCRRPGEPRRETAAEVSQ